MWLDKLCDSCPFSQVLGESLHPGGLKLTARVAEVAELSRNSRVLDASCGNGRTTFFLAQKYHCQVVGIDLSPRMISFCQDRLLEERLTDKLSFVLGNGENLPFLDSTFDVVVSECSLTLMSRKEKAASEARRVLRRGGKFVLTDVFLREGDAKEAQRETTIVPCLAAARWLSEQAKLLTEAGFGDLYLEDHSEESKRIAFQIGSKFGGLRGFLDKLSTASCLYREETEQIEAVIKSHERLFNQSKFGYALVAGVKP